MNRKSFIAGADLTDKIGYAVKPADGKIVLASVAGEACFGVLMNDNVADRAVGVALTGDVCKAKAGGAVAMGALLATDANGKLVTAGENAEVVAMALEAGVANDLIYVVVK